MPHPPKSGNRLAADNVLQHARSERKPATAAAGPAKKRQVSTKTKRLPTAPKPPVELLASKEILGLFQRTFSQFFDRTDQHELLQAVKGHLFNRDYAAAFGSPENLEAYVVRWSPSRAMCYRSVFLDLCDELSEVFDVASRPATTTEIVCMGGGAGAELVAAAAAVKGLLPRVDPRPGAPVPPPILSTLHMAAIDVAAWEPAFAPLLDAVKSVYLPPQHQGIFSATFHQADVIAPETDLAALVPRSTRLVTLLFTTNELYTQSRAATTKMLLNLGGMVEKGCLLVVLESAGSYSTIKIGEKDFPMGFLLEHTLLGEGGKGGEWDKVMGEEAKWYRLPQAQMVNGQALGTGLKYPLSLENMRYFVRVFKKL